MRLMVFSKHLAEFSLVEAARRLHAIGVYEIDLTVRPGGHIEPERADEELPRAVEALAAGGIRIGMISTGITEAFAPETEIVLRAAARAGIKYYKFGYFQYENFGSLRRARDEARARLRDLAALNQELGLVGGYHNHSANFLGAVVSDVEYLLADTAPEAAGLYFDPAHAVIEGGSKGWMMSLDLLQERLVMLAVKDFRWVEAARGYSGGRAHSVQFCPLEMGNVPWPEVLRCLRALHFSGPISLHSEYQGRYSFRDLNGVEVLEQTARDKQLLCAWNEEI